MLHSMAEWKDSCRQRQGEHTRALQSAQPHSAADALRKHGRRRRRRAKRTSPRRPATPSSRPDDRRSGNTSVRCLTRAPPVAPEATPEPSAGAPTLCANTEPRGGHARPQAVARRTRRRVRRARAATRVEAPLEEACSQAEPGSASCVQRFDDSLNSAIRTTYRISLRSSSLREPRYPSARVVCVCSQCELTSRHAAPGAALRRRAAARRATGDGPSAPRRRTGDARRPRADGRVGELSSRNDSRPRRRGGAHAPNAAALDARRGRETRASRAPPSGIDVRTSVGGGKTGNDPSAGSPTETLLRLLLPLNDKVWTASRGIAAGEPAALPQSGGLTGSFNR